MTIVGERVGPVYSRAQMLEAGLPLGELVSFVLRGSEEVYPAAQFDLAEGRLHLRADVAGLWDELLDSSLDPLGAWLWLTGPRDGLEGFSPLEHLTRRGRDERLDVELRSLPSMVAAA